VKSPVRPTMLPYGRQAISEDDIAAVVEVLRSDWITSGPTVGAFEDALAAAAGARHVVAISNGTAALHAAAAAIGVGPGDEVIVPALTFAASANCVRYLGGTVVFADVQPDTMSIDPAGLERLITPRTKAVVAVDYAGAPADMDEVNAIAAAHRIAVIEDACHSLGATYRGRKVGGLATCTAFSFHPVKHITTGEGGAIATDDPEIARRMRAFRNHGITASVQERERAGTWWYEMASLGFNYRITDIQCALGLSQIKRLPAFIARRQAIARQYAEATRRYREVELPVVGEGRTSSWHLYPVRLHLDRLSCGPPGGVRRRCERKTSAYRCITFRFPGILTTRSSATGRAAGRTPNRAMSGC